MTLSYLLLAIATLIITWRVAKNPFFGLLVMLAVNPVEALFKLPGDVSVGRLVGAIAVIGWLVHLHRHGGVRRRLRQAKLVKVVWAFPIVCVVGVVLSETSSSNIDSYSWASVVVLLALMSLMIETLVGSQRRMNQLMMVVALSSAVAAIFPFAYFFGIDLYSPLGVDAAETVTGGRAAGLASSGANALGLATSMGLFAVLIFVSVQRRIWITLSFSAIALVMIGGLLLSGSRTHFVAFVVCILALGGLQLMGPKKGRSGSILAALVVFSLLPFAYLRAPEKLQERFIVVGKGVRTDTIDRADFTKHQRQQALGVLLDHPLLGLGLQSFGVLEDVGVHDTVSAVLGETGLLGVLAISWLVVRCWRWQYRGIRIGSRKNLDLYRYSAGFMASLAAMLVASLGGYIVFYQRWFWITIGTSAVIARWAEAAERRRGCIEGQGRVGAFAGGTACCALPSSSWRGHVVRQGETGGSNRRPWRGRPALRPASCGHSNLPNVKPYVGAAGIAITEE